MTPCELCAADAGVLDFGRPCCVARYIAKLPALDVRRGWMERLRVKNSVEFMERVEERLREIWGKKNDVQNGV